jgi:hypothetical protein
MVHKYHHQPPPLEAGVDERGHDEGLPFMMDPLARPAHHPDDVPTRTVQNSRQDNDDPDAAAERSPKRLRRHDDGSMEDSLSNNNNNNNDDSTMMMMARVMEESEGLVAATTTTAAVATASALAEADAAAAAKKQVHNEQWNEMLERLGAFKAEYGHCLVPKRFADDPRLGTWVETQRVQVRRS